MHICSMFYGINDFTAYNIAYRAASAPDRSVVEDA